MDFSRKDYCYIHLFYDLELVEYDTKNCLYLRFMVENFVVICYYNFVVGCLKVNIMVNFV